MHSTATKLRHSQSLEQLPFEFLFPKYVLLPLESENIALINTSYTPAQQIAILPPRLPLQIQQENCQYRELPSLFR